MTTFVMRDGKLIEKRFAPERCRSSLSAPTIISDTIDPFFSHADGKMYDSKCRYYNTLKEKGLRIVEEPKGAPQNYKDDPITPSEVADAYRKVRDGYKPAPLETEELYD